LPYYIKLVKKYDIMNIKLVKKYDIMNRSEAREQIGKYSYSLLLLRFKVVNSVMFAIEAGRTRI